MASAQQPTGEGDRWQAGFEWDPETCAAGAVYAFDCEPEDVGGPLVEWDDAEDNPDCGTNDPVMLHLQVDRVSVGWRTFDFEGVARRQMEAATSKLLEGEFWSGAQNAANQALTRDVTTLDSTGVSALRALAILEQGLADCPLGSRGMIHAPVQLVSLWSSLGSAIREDGNRLVTVAKGNIVVAGSGYSGSAPTDAAPATGELWAYATGMVQVRLGQIEIVPGELPQAFARRVNKITYHAQRTASAVFDPCCGPLGVKVDLDA